ncbi:MULTISPECIES: SspB family protein [Novacetimonas]|uniref:Stringent starvation protein B n=2 Tax=Novacetimonas hansenii TaxID=436 RepID=A0ABQ0SAY2_NOVHA|nr:ClpXP protease specificity-enhancing factor SspB [Novacetimonas hansenii]EFG85598.1 hypothetical protein GXY_02026 [Novacetimonas hansenii ATCC 23769]RFP05553.1 hypothetical protein BGC30_09920 [Novacetimonas hansenii]WEQ57927.1 ClpXP protease specificity-enhancing factor SspB [Novacetimonas hansenii]CUW46160.1 Stringent starvation protein B [Novacetimonas hansenii]GAN84062.1 hypothetical protein Gaha_0123_007 [Novacetimonas hansenii JCM 7643]
MSDDHDEENGFETSIPDSLLPYDDWIEDAYRDVMLRAFEYVVTEGGLPGDHHFYLTFRTDWPGVEMPERVRAQYPHEITIVLQHQFHGLKVDRAAGTISVSLAFGGVPATLVIPVAAISAFADPSVKLPLSFRVPEHPPQPAPSAEIHNVFGQGQGQGPRAPQPEQEAHAPGAQDATPTSAEETQPSSPQVVSLAAFRKRGTEPG